MSQIAILEAFAEIEDPRRRAGVPHTLGLCLALFTLAIAAGNKGFLAMGDWMRSYHEQLVDLLKPPKNRLPSYSTQRPCLVTYRLRTVFGMPRQFQRCFAGVWRNHRSGWQGAERFIFT